MHGRSERGDLALHMRSGVPICKKLGTRGHRQRGYLVELLCCVRRGGARWALEALPYDKEDLSEAEAMRAEETWRVTCMRHSAWEPFSSRVAQHAEHEGYWSTLLRVKPAAFSNVTVILYLVLHIFFFLRANEPCSLQLPLGLKGVRNPSYAR